MKDLDLEKKRIEAGLSQNDMAVFLSVSQSQISRYEKDPESVPYGMVQKWNQYCGEVGKLAGIKIEDPRVEINSRLKLIDSYADASKLNLDINEIGISFSDFIKNIKIESKKPRIGVFGKFDAGKSTLINTIIGGDNLPTGYQPATSVVSLIRHISEKPKWQAEDVWIMKKGFDFEQSNDEKHCLEHKMFAGGYESLRKFGTHSGDGVKHKAFAAIVYIDSPILLATDILDLPGYGHSDDDQNRAEMGHKTVDVLIYVSSISGFLDHNDLIYLSVLLKNLPINNYNKKDLSNLFIVGTQAHIVTNELERDKIIRISSERAFKHLDNTIHQRSEEITIEDFKKRFYFFSVDEKSIRNKFEKDISNLLIKTIPLDTLFNIQRCIFSGKNTAKKNCNSLINRLRFIINERDAAKKDYYQIISGEEDRKRKNESARASINKKITLYKTETSSYIEKLFDEKTSVNSLERMIKTRYDNKKDAQSLAGTYLIDSLQVQINEFVKIKADDLGHDIESMLSSFGPKIDNSSKLADGFSFNPQVAFMSALSGIGTIGALAAWASIAAAGSNLGAYILVGQVVGWLSSIGISVGGAASAMSFVSAIGGPITLGIAAAILVALGIFSLFGDSWQLKLAKKINENLLKESVEEKMKSSASDMWDSTLSAFNSALEATEKEYQKNINSLYVMAFSTEISDIEKEVDIAEDTRDFFAGIPWREVL